jgi:glycosyltransferase involved in cell wall biosynthesis
MSGLRNAKRAVYRAAVGTVGVAALGLRQRGKTQGHEIGLFYGGALGGALGGPRVKVDLLKSAFPSRLTDFSLVYLLSNALYVPDFALDRIRAAGIPIVVNQNGVFYPAWFPDQWEAENARMAAALSRATHVLFQSEFSKASVAKFVGVEPASSEILYNGVDTLAFRPAVGEERESTDGKQRPFRFLLTGKIGASTGYRLIGTLEGVAAARRSGVDVDLLVAGSLSEDVAATARKCVDELGIAEVVQFTGPFSRVEAPDIYRGADAYIITKHNDPCPNVVLEALASGLPVLYVASGGVPELVGSDAGVGLTVPETFDEVPVPPPLAIAEGMARVVAGRADMAAAARQRAVARFSLNGWLHRHRELFSALTGPRGAAGPDRPSG